MKKGISLVLALVMCLSLCACGKSEAASNVEELISAIGEVSLESKDAISSAQEAFDALSEDEKAEVENYYMLVESQDTLRKLEEIEVEETKRANGKEAYDNIKYAWTIANQIGTDIYSVWHGWVFEKDDMSSKGLQFFVDKTSLSMDEIVEGFSAKNYVNEQYAKTGVTWLEIDEDMKQFYRDATIDVF